VSVCFRARRGAVHVPYEVLRIVARREQENIRFHCEFEMLRLVDFQGAVKRWRRRAEK